MESSVVDTEVWVPANEAVLEWSLSRTQYNDEGHLTVCPQRMILFLAEHDYPPEHCFVCGNLIV